MQKNFDLSTGQLSEEHRRELVPDGAELVAWGVYFDREFGSSVFTIGKWLIAACFLTSVFPFRSVFPATSRKRIEQLLPQSPNLPFQ